MFVFKSLPVNCLFVEYQTVNMSQSKQFEICNTAFTRKASLRRHMLKKHLNKEPSGPYIMSMTPSSQADNFRMQHLDYSSTVYDDTVVRPTVDKCLENFKKLKRKYVDLERAHILLQAKLKSSEDVKSSENETSDSEESQSGDESDEVHSESKKPGSTRLAKIMPAFKRLKTMPSSIQKKFIDTCHNDLIRCIGSCTRHIINGKAKLTPDEVKSERNKLGSTHLAKIVPELNRLKSMSPL